MSCRTIAGTAAGGVSYHYDNVDAASSVIRYQTIAGAAMGGESYCYAIVSAASSGLRYTELSRAPPPCACERLVTFVLQRMPIGAECAMELSQAPPWVA